MNYSQMERLDVFHGLNSVDIRLVCECFGAKIHNYNKGETIVREDRNMQSNTAKHLGIVLDGQATAGKEGEYIGILEFGQPNGISSLILAEDRLTVLFIPFNKLTRPCSKNCSAHLKILNNFIGAICSKAIFLQEHVNCLIKPTVRERVIAYLTQCYNKQLKYGNESDTVDITLDRERLAKHLNTQRSALSRELSKMKKDGIIDYHKNSFRLL